MAITNKVKFRNFRCGDLCANKGEIVLELNSRCDYIDIEDQLRIQGWQIIEINGKSVHSICGCGDAIFLEGGKYCKKCIENHKTGSISAISHEKHKYKAQKKNERLQRNKECSC